MQEAIRKIEEEIQPVTQAEQEPITEEEIQPIAQTDQQPVLPFVTEQEIYADFQSVEKILGQALASLSKEKISRGLIFKAICHPVIISSTFLNYFFTNYPHYLMGINSASINVVLNELSFQRDLRKLGNHFRGKTKKQLVALTFLMILVIAGSFASSMSAYQAMDVKLRRFSPPLALIFKIFNGLNLGVNTLVVFSPPLFEAIASELTAYPDAALRDAKQWFIKAIGRVKFVKKSLEKQELLGILKTLVLQPEGFCDGLKRAYQRRQELAPMLQNAIEPAGSTAITLKILKLMIKGIIILGAVIAIAPSTNKGMKDIFKHKITEEVCMAGALPFAYFLAESSVFALCLLSSLFLRIFYNFKDSWFAGISKLCLITLCGLSAYWSISTILNQVGAGHANSAGVKSDPATEPVSFLVWKFPVVEKMIILIAAGASLLTNFRAIMNFSLPATEWLYKKWQDYPAEESSRLKLADQKLIEKIGKMIEAIDDTSSPDQIRDQMQKNMKALEPRIHKVSEERQSILRTRLFYSIDQATGRLISSVDNSNTPLGASKS